MDLTRRVRAGLTWTGPDALHALLSVAPAVVLTAAGEVAAGAAAAVGVLPVGLVGIGATRRSRLAAIGIGFLFAAGLVVGAWLAQWSALAVVGMVVLPYLCAVLAASRPLGRLMLVMILPSVAIGLSFHPPSDSFGIAGFIVAGSVWAGLLALAWPEQNDPPRQPDLMPMAFARRYGLLLGGAAGTATLVGVLLDVEHLGWAATAALLVMRPRPDMLELRGTGRVTATVAGALLAHVMLGLHTPVVLYAIGIGGAVVAAFATRTSRWYVTSGATGFLVLILSLYGHAGPAEIRHTFWARVAETVFGVALAYLFGVAIPAFLARRRARDPVRAAE